MPTIPDLHALAVDLDEVLHSHGVSVPAVDLLRALPGVLNPPTEGATMPATIAPTVPACPDWCTLRPGHDWDSIADDDTLVRGHEQSRQSWDLTNHKAGVVIGCQENASGPQQGLQAPYIFVSGGHELTAAEARRLSGTIAEAADALDDIARAGH